MIESALRDNLIPKVPLAEVRAHVIVGHHVRDALDFRRHHQLVSGHSGCVWVQAGHDRGARGGAHCLSNVGVSEDDALVCQRIQIWGLDEIVAVAA